MCVSIKRKIISERTCKKVLIVYDFINRSTILRSKYINYSTQLIANAELCRIFLDSFASDTSYQGKEVYLIGYKNHRNAQSGSHGKARYCSSARSHFFNLQNKTTVFQNSLCYRSFPWI